MEAQQATAKKFVLNYGLTLGILMVLLGVIMYVFNYHLEPHWVFSVISFLIFIAVVAYGIHAFKKENGGFLSLGEAIKVAVGIALIAGILSGVWTVLLATVIEPDYMTQLTEMQRENAREQFPQLTEQQLDSSMEMGAWANNPWVAFLLGLAGSLLFGLVVGLIAGLAMRQKRPYEV